eukprot:m.485441 g.485441  ORF g.485441 m.485441 type:complete len:595 (-) comp57207_c0_seq6:794-2578(-)
MNDSCPAGGNRLANAELVGVRQGVSAGLAEHLIGQPAHIPHRESKAEQRGILAKTKRDGRTRIGNLHARQTPATQEKKISTKQKKGTNRTAEEALQIEVRGRRKRVADGAGPGSMRLKGAVREQLALDQLDPLEGSLSRPSAWVRQLDDLMCEWRTGRGALNNNHDHVKGIPLSLHRGHEQHRRPVALQPELREGGDFAADHAKNADFGRGWALDCHQINGQMLAELPGGIEVDFVVGRDLQHLFLGHAGAHSHLSRRIGGRLAELDQSGVGVEPEQPVVCPASRPSEGQQRHRTVLHLRLGEHLANLSAHGRVRGQHAQKLLTQRADVTQQDFKRHQTFRAASFGLFEDPRRSGHDFRLSGLGALHLLTMRLAHGGLWMAESEVAVGLATQGLPLAQLVDEHIREGWKVAQEDVVVHRQQLAGLVGSGITHSLRRHALREDHQSGMRIAGSVLEHDVAKCGHGNVGIQLCLVNVLAIIDANDASGTGMGGHESTRNVKKNGRSRAAVGAAVGAAVASAVGTAGCVHRVGTLRSRVAVRAEGHAAWCGLRESMIIKLGLDTRHEAELASLVLGHASRRRDGGEALEALGNKPLL